MKKSKEDIILFITGLIIIHQGMLLSQPVLYTPDNPNIIYTGRIDFSNPEKPRLIGAGAYFELKFRGRSCELLLEDQNLYDNYNYISIVIDGNYRGRIKIQKSKTKYRIAKNLKDKDHRVLICKATEAQIGYIDFLGIICDEIGHFEKDRKRRIEFIGNSITCGMGLDQSDIPCDSGKWFDQHNSYLAYGPQTALELEADWLLSSVSGIGMTRNWNSPGPTMPEVYKSTYLDVDSTSLWNARIFIPDLVSICLGQNDFSDGDGTTERAPLDSATFVNDYILFVKDIRNRYPYAEICCLTSPMLSGEKSVHLANYLSAVIKHFKIAEGDDRIERFVFSRSYTNGCSYHPNQEEHQEIVKELLPFYKRIMNW